MDNSEWFAKWWEAVWQTNSEEQKLTVCAECLRASCWHGEFMCEKSGGADILEIDRARFDELKLEAPQVWIRQQLVNGEISESEYRRQLSEVSND